MTTGVLIIEVDAPAKVEVAARWFEAWLPRLTYVSKNTGCGCCVDIYEVEGDEAAVAAIPRDVGGEGDGRSKPRPEPAPPPRNPYEKLLAKIRKKERRKGR